MTTFDDTVASAMAWLEDEVAPHVDVEAGLAMLRDERPLLRAPDRRNRWVAVAGAAAIVAVGVVGLVVWQGGDDDRGPVAPSVDPTAVTTLPSTDPNGTTTPTDEPGESTATTPADSSAPPTSAAPAVDIAGPWPRFDPAAPFETTFLLGDAAPVSGELQRRPDWSDQDGPDTPYDQWFVGPEAVLRITTYAGVQRPVNGDPLPFPPGEWTAHVPPMAPGFASVQLHADGGTVHVWAKGLTQQQVVDVARVLDRREGGRPGWDVTFDGTTGVAALGVEPWSEGWATTARTVSTAWISPTGGLVGEMLVGCCGLETWGLWDGYTLVQVGERTVGVLDHGSVVSASWVEGDGVTVTVGFVGASVDDLLAFVATVHPVDRSVWEALPQEVGDGDGCNSLFC